MTERGKEVAKLNCNFCGKEITARIRKSCNKHFCNATCYFNYKKKLPSFLSLEYQFIFVETNNNLKYLGYVNEPTESGFSLLLPFGKRDLKKEDIRLIEVI